MSKECVYTHAARDYDGTMQYFPCGFDAKVAVVARFESGSGTTFVQGLLCEEHGSEFEPGQVRHVPGIYKETLLAVARR